MVFTVAQNHLEIMRNQAMRNKDTKIWKILAGAYMIYSITADIILLMGLVWLIASGGF